MKQLMAVLVLAIMAVEWRQGYFARAVRRDGARAGLQVLGAALAITAVVVAFDPTLHSLVQRLRSPLVDPLIRFGGWLGYRTVLWTILAAAYVAAAVARRRAIKSAAFGCLVSVTLASLGSQLLKFGVGRARPNTSLGHLSFFNWSESLRNNGLFQSFPSGDVVVVGAVAWYLVLRYRRMPRLAQGLVLLVPLATACSRVTLDRHWPSDTIFSLALALAAAQWVVRYEAVGRSQQEGAHAEAAR